METIAFSYNWNNKLDCKAFSTIRLHQPKRWVPLSKVHIQYKKEYRGTGTIMEVKVFKLPQLNQFMAFLDTGYNVEEAKKIIYRMYPKIDFETQLLNFILIVKD